MTELPSGQPLFHVTLLFSEPRCSHFAPITRTHLESLRQCRLVRDVVANDPVAPRQLRPICKLRKPCQKTNCRDGGIRRWVECDPAAAWKICLHPAVSIARAHDVIAAQVVEFSGQESVNLAGRNSERAKHYRHGGGKVLAVSCPRLKKEM